MEQYFISFLKCEQKAMCGGIITQVTYQKLKMIERLQGIQQSHPNTKKYEIFTLVQDLEQIKEFNYK